MTVLPTGPDQSAEDIKQKWKDLVRVHQCTKSILLKFEEFGGRTFLQPVREQRDALEHVMRAVAAEMRLVERHDDYVCDNLTKALGHEYRAFFDVADELSITVRERILESLESYSRECIATTFPAYYQKIRPAIEEICSQIAKIRNGKDVSEPGVISNEVEEYNAAIDRLLEYMREAGRRIPSLEDYKRRGRFRRAACWIFLLIAGAALTLLVEHYLSEWLGWRFPQ